MAEQNEPKIIWSVKNPYGHDVILKEDTYNNHLITDHNKTDAEFRKKMANSIPEIIAHPSYIVKDKEHDDRYQYIAPTIISVDNIQSKIKLITTFIDTDRNPHEVVTWFPKKDMTVNKGDVVYEANKGILR